ncbi:hypothetical protein MMC14_001872 [Varicellaria rhodocarpa]|nr:hypothetical protein [Varicellaria rhodocarpa]
MIALRNDFLSFSRKADAKISLLKDVAGRVQKGEDVDVEGLLGTGNEEQEKEWEEVLREIEEEERLWKSKEKRNAKEKVITSDDIKNAIGEATIKRDSAPRHPRAKPPIRLVSTDDNIDDIDGIPPKTMSNDISTQTETEKRRPARFF